jgi:hypothetical protein
MDTKKAERDRFDWRLLLYATMGASIFYVPVILFGLDVVQALYVFAAVPIISLVLLIVAIRTRGRRGLVLFSMMVVYMAVSLSLFKYSFELRTSIRWLLRSKNYKAKVLAQSNSPNAALRHIEWDGWGFPGAGNTVVYLVFDPNDLLATPARNHARGKFSGIPCEVSRVNRLESHYYTVLFYTSTDWAHCN